MKRTNLLMILVLGVLVVFMLGGPGSSAVSYRQAGIRAGGSSSGRQPFRSDSGQQNESSPAAQSDGDEDQDVDPDLGKFGGRIDRETYLRKRDEFIALKRGIEPGRPFDPQARGQAIRQT